MSATGGNLSDLHPIVVPEAVSAWPLAPGWWVVAVVLAAAGLALALRAWRKRRAERYRRDALRELARLNDAQGMPVLLKRAALSAFGREAVAGLSGPDWHRFLDATAGSVLFDIAPQGPGRLLDQASYGSSLLDDKQTEILRAAVHRWLLIHRREVPC